MPRRSRAGGRQAAGEPARAGAVEHAPFGLMVAAGGRAAGARAGAVEHAPFGLMVAAGGRAAGARAGAVEHRKLLLPPMQV